MSDIATKLITAADNTPAVAEAVNAAKATASGASIRVGDVLDTEHPLQVQTAAGAAVTVMGKNFFDISKVKTDTTVINNGNGTITAINFGTACRTYLREVCPELKVGDVVALSFVSESAIKQMYLVTAKTAWLSGKALTITQDMLDSLLVFYAIRNNEGVVSPATISDIQVEQGEIVTPFEPYKAPQAAQADSSGKVAGLRSVSPTMTVFADDGSAVQCTYFPQSAADTYAKYQELKTEETALQEKLQEYLQEDTNE